MKLKFEIQVAASLTKWYDIEAETETEAKALAEKRMKADVVIEQTAVGGSWDLVERVVEQVLPANDEKDCEKDGEEHPKQSLYEIDFEDGYSMVIRATHKPTLDEANRWLAPDIEQMKCGPVTNVTDEISEEDARQFYDFTNERKWPVFGADEKK